MAASLSATLILSLLVVFFMSKPPTCFSWDNPPAPCDACQLPPPTSPDCPPPPPSEQTGYPPPPPSPPSPGSGYYYSPPPPPGYYPNFPPPTGYFPGPPPPNPVLPWFPWYYKAPPSASASVCSRPMMLVWTLGNLASLAFGFLLF